MPLHEHRGSSTHGSCAPYAQYDMRHAYVGAPPFTSGIVVRITLVQRVSASHIALIVWVQTFSEHTPLTESQRHAAAALHESSAAKEEQGDGPHAGGLSIMFHMHLLF